MPTKYSFDAVRYCENNANRMGQMPDGRFIADLMLEEITSLRLRAEQAEKERGALVGAIHKAMLRQAESDKKQTIGQLVSDVAFLGRVAKDHFDARAKAEARCKRLEEACVHVYNSGYHAGHHDTVEGRYVDIHTSDMGTYHTEEVEELREALEEK